MRASSLPPSLVHLPNAAHIDWMLRSLRTNPTLWGAAWDAAWDAAGVAAWDAAGVAAWGAAGGAARVAAWGAARDAAGVAAWGAARVAARDALDALVAWDHAGVALHMSDSGFAAALALDPHLMLLAPARYVLKQEKK